VSYLLDTNTVSELTKEKPNPAVVTWLRQNQNDCFVSVVTIGELVKGVELLPEGRKRRRLSRELRFLQEDYSDRILPYDEITAIEWGRLYAGAKKRNRLLPLEDSLIEATALTYELAVAAHNRSDFFVVSTVDPWEYQESQDK
jgi:predicted nucleic acid-binding protein